MLILLAVHLPALFLLWLIFHLHLSSYLFRQIILPTLLLPTFPTPTCQFRLLCSNLRKRFSCPKTKHHELLIAKNKALKAQINLLKALGHSNSQFSAKDGIILGPTGDNLPSQTLSDKNNGVAVQSGSLCPISSPSVVLSPSAILSVAGDHPPEVATHLGSTLGNSSVLPVSEAPISHEVATSPVLIMPTGVPPSSVPEPLAIVPLNSQAEQHNGSAAASKISSLSFSFSPLVDSDIKSLFSQWELAISNEVKANDTIEGIKNVDFAQFEQFL
jgi:hypothetical protein